MSSLLQLSTPTPALTPRRVRSAWPGLLRAFSLEIVLLGLWLGINGFLTLGFFVALNEKNHSDACILSCAVVFMAVGLHVARRTGRKILRKRWLLTYGMLSQGHVHGVAPNNRTQVNERPITRITWRFRDNLDREQEGFFDTFNTELIAAHPQGQAIDVLFDPTEPSISAVPSLMRARFEPAEEVVDLREALDGATLAVSSPPAPRTTVQEWRLEATPTRARGGCLGLGGNPSASSGHLHAAPRGLRQFDAEGGVLASVRWDTPFVVQLSVWLLADGQLELGVTLISRGLGTGERVRFLVELPQQAADRSLPMQQIQAPYLSAEALRELWPALDFYAQSHGDDLRGKLRLG